MYKLIFKYNLKYVLIAQAVFFLVVSSIFTYLSPFFIVHIAIFLAIVLVNENLLIKHTIFKDFTHLAVFPLSYKEKYIKIYWEHFFSPKIISCIFLLFFGILFGRFDIFDVLFLLYFYIVFNFFSVLLCTFGRRSKYGIRVIPEILTTLYFLLMFFCGLLDMAYALQPDKWHYVLHENINTFFININIYLKILFLVLLSLLSFWCYFQTKKVIERVAFFDINIVKEGGGSWEKYFSKE